MKRIATEPTPTDEQQVGRPARDALSVAKEARTRSPGGDFRVLVGAPKHAGGSAEWATGGLQWPELP